MLNNADNKETNQKSNLELKNNNESKVTREWSSEKISMTIKKMIDISQSNDVVGIKNLQPDGLTLYTNIMMDKFVDFYEKYPDIFSKVIDGIINNNTQCLAEFLVPNNNSNPNQESEIKNNVKSEVQRNWPSNEILLTIKEMIRISKSDAMIEIKNSQYGGLILYMDAMVNKFNDFYERYPELFAKVAMGVTNNDLKRIAEFLVMNDKINAGSISRARGEFILGTKLAKDFNLDNLIDTNKRIPD
jgi:hypothetical protein